MNPIRPVLSVIKVATLLLLASGVAPSHAAIPVDTPEANKKLVLDFWRVVIETRNADAAVDYYAPDFIQHNALSGGGIAGFKARTKLLWDGAVKLDVQPILQNPPVLVIAEGDLVQLVWKRSAPEPTDPAKTYYRYSFDLYRVKNGQIVEHWDSVTK